MIKVPVLAKLKNTVWVQLLNFITTAINKLPTATLAWWSSEGLSDLTSSDFEEKVVFTWYLGGENCCLVKC